MKTKKPAVEAAGHTKNHDLMKVRKSRYGNDSRFDHNSLPLPAEFYADELGSLRGSGAWRQVCCCFHDDKSPSLSVNIQTGGFKCHACGTKGGDIIDFQRLRYGQSFPEAVQVLGAWRDQP